MQLFQRSNADNTWNGNVDVTDSFDILGVSLSTVGGMVNFRATFSRKVTPAGGLAPQIRLLFPDREDSCNSVQYAGSIVYQDGSYFDIYPAIITQFGTFEPMDRYLTPWINTGVGDKVTFDGSWFIEETS